MFAASRLVLILHLHIYLHCIVVHNCLWHFCNSCHKSRVPERCKCTFSTKVFYHIYFHRSISSGGVLKCSECVEGKCVCNLYFILLHHNDPDNQQENNCFIPRNEGIENSVFCFLVPSSNEQRNVGGDAFLNERLNLNFEHHFQWSKQQALLLFLSGGMGWRAAWMNAEPLLLCVLLISSWWEAVSGRDGVSSPSITLDTMWASSRSSSFVC